MVSTGWIRYMRQSLGMTMKILANRTGLSIPTIAQAEKGEIAGRITIGTLEAMAKGMNCDFVYAFVPKTNIDKMIKNEALTKAKRILSNADTHMTLENQRVKQPFEERVRALAGILLKKGDVW
ncbi:MAG: hypothetical protein A2583_09915 [Bdellovibrionales bacterium RIFOXYD1_FULL_53_11]|nr:MAG: hypothetical protein A2583_09915 [Bdellovibrionales bacterium RIFOXYD1_FULL_53_11]